jgi:hypothetical protein
VRAQGWGDGGFVKIRRVRTLLLLLRCCLSARNAAHCVPARHRSFQGTNFLGVESQACRASISGCPVLADVDPAHIETEGTKSSSSPFEVQNHQRGILPFIPTDPCPGCADEGENENLVDEVADHDSGPLGSVDVGARIQARTDHPLVLEAALFAAQTLLSAPTRQHGFACIPAPQAVVNSSSLPLDSEQAKSIHLEVLSADQQVSSGLRLHVMFAFTTTDARCPDAQGTYDGVLFGSCASRSLAQLVSFSCVRAQPRCSCPRTVCSASSRSPRRRPT